jgi:hypothetical protein
VSVPDSALLNRMASGPSTLSSRGLIGTSSLLGTGSGRGAHTGGTWSSSLAGSGSLGSALGVPATPQQPAAAQQQQQGGWQQGRRVALQGPQQVEPSRVKDDTDGSLDGSQLVQDL